MISMRDSHFTSFSHNEDYPQNDLYFSIILQEIIFYSGILTN